MQYFCTYVYIKVRLKRPLQLPEVYPSYKDSTSYFISKEVMRTRGISESVSKINLDLFLEIRAIPPSPGRSGAPGLVPYT